VLTPARRRGTEILDDPHADAALALRSLRDIALANRLFGGRRAVLQELDCILRVLPPGATPLTLLDVGTGLGDIPAAAARLAAGRGHPLRTVGVERTRALTAAASPRCAQAVTADGLHLPFADRSIDVVTCSQVLHHFDGEEAHRLLQECTRVARVAVIIGELRRSWLAAGGLWLSSFLLGFHAVSRHDGVVSVFRGYTRGELRDLVLQATACPSGVRQRAGFRLTAVWSPRAPEGRAPTAPPASRLD
jgi:SAM-dependent methyltransferase